MSAQVSLGLKKDWQTAGDRKESRTPVRMQPCSWQKPQVAQGKYSSGRHVRLRLHQMTGRHQRPNRFQCLLKASRNGRMIMRKIDRMPEHDDRRRPVAARKISALQQRRHACRLAPARARSSGSKRGPHLRHGPEGVPARISRKNAHSRPCLFGHEAGRHWSRQVGPKASDAIQPSVTAWSRSTPHPCDACFFCLQWPAEPLRRPAVQQWRLRGVPSGARPHC